MERRYEQSSRDNNRHSYSRHHHLDRSYRSERYSSQRTEDSSTKYPSLSSTSTRRPETSSSTHRDTYIRNSNEFRALVTEEKLEKTDPKAASTTMKQETAQEQIVLSYPSHIPQQIVLSYPSQVPKPQQQPAQEKEQVISFSLEEEEEEERLLKSSKKDKKQEASINENQAKERESLEEWVMHKSEKGETYYYNRLTRESVWQLPTCVKQPNNKDEKVAATNELMSQSSSKDVVIDIEEEETKEADVWVMHKSDRGEPYYYNKLTRQSVWKLPTAANSTSQSKDKQEKKVDDKLEPKNIETKLRQDQPKQRTIGDSNSTAITDSTHHERSRNDSVTLRQRTSETAVPTPNTADSRIQENCSKSNARENDARDRKYSRNNDSERAKAESSSNTNHRDMKSKEITGNSKSLTEQVPLKRKRTRSPLPPLSARKSYSHVRHLEARPRSPPPPHVARGYYHYYRSPSPPPLPPSPDRYYPHHRRYDDYEDRRLPPPPPWYYKQQQEDHFLRQERMRPRERYHDMRRYPSDPYYHRQSRSPPSSRGRDY